MALATLEELSARLDWDLSDEESRSARGALEDLSDQAVYYGHSGWDDTNVPRIVRSTILAAAARFMRNPDGYTQSRAGDETLTWTDRGHDAGTAYFTEREIKMIQGVAGRGGIVSASVSAWGPQVQVAEGYVPVAGSTEKPFPLFASDTNPW